MSCTGSHPAVTTRRARFGAAAWAPRSRSTSSDRQVAHPLGEQRSPRRQQRRADLSLAVGVELAAVGGRGPPDAHIFHAFRKDTEDRLKVAPLTLADTLRKEMLDFRVRTTASANETFSAREGAHDDLVLAVAQGIHVGSYQTGTVAPGPNPLDRVMMGRRRFAR